MTTTRHHVAACVNASAKSMPHALAGYLARWSYEPCCTGLLHHLAALTLLAELLLSAPVLSWLHHGAAPHWGRSSADTGGVVARARERGGRRHVLRIGYARCDGLLCLLSDGLRWEHPFAALKHVGLMCISLH